MKHITSGNNLDRQYMKKYGHPWYKEYEKGDERKAVFPERIIYAGMGFIYTVGTKRLICVHIKKMILKEEDMT
jgi:hypothetical protein